MKFERVIAVRTKKTIYRDHDRVIKVFDSEYAKSAILNEALNDARAEESGLPVPHLLEVASFDGKWAIVTEYIEGKTLEQLMKENLDKKDEYLNLFIKLQCEVFSKEIPLLNKNKDKLIRKIAESGLDANTQYELHTVLASMPNHTHALHGDFNPSNIIIRSSDGKAFIIDWSHFSKGNSSYDIARTYLLLQLTGDLNLAEKYLDNMVQYSKIERGYILKWLSLVAASELATCRKEEVEFLKHFVNIVDHE